MSLALKNWALDDNVNNVDPDQMTQSVVSDLILNCLLRPVFLNTLGNYTMML